MNKKCPNCGFINFVYAEACHKCETALSETPVRSAYDYPATYRGGVNSHSQPYPTKSSFPFLKVLAGAGVVVIVLAIVGAVAIGNLVRYRKVKWIEYRPDGLDFTVMMPSKPTRLEPIVTPLATGNMSNHRHVSGVAGQGTVMLCYVNYTGTLLEMEQAAEALDAELDSFLQRTNATLISKKSITYQGMPGLDFEISPPDNTGPKISRSYGKMFMTPSRFYFLSITATEDSDLFAGKDKFLNPKIRTPGNARKPVDPPNITLVPNY